MLGNSMYIFMVNSIRNHQKMEVLKLTEYTAECLNSLINMHEIEVNSDFKSEMIILYVLQTLVDNFLCPLNSSSKII